MLLQAGLSSVCSSGASHGDVSFEHTEHTLWCKVSEYCSCIASFLEDVCLVCSKEASHRDVSFEHTEQTFRWEIIKIFVNIKNKFWVLKWVFR